jgi:hypothetical protein
MANDFIQVRLASFNASEKLQRGEKLSTAELDNLRKHAEMAGTIESRVLYARAKKAVEVNEE